MRYRSKNFLFFIFFAGVAVTLFYLGFFFLFGKSIATQISHLSKEVTQANLDEASWIQIDTDARDLPRIFPISNVRNSFLLAGEIVGEIRGLETHLLSLGDENSIQTNKLLDVFASLQQIRDQLGSIEWQIRLVPNFLLSADQQIKKQDLLRKIKTFENVLDNSTRMESILKKFIGNQKRLAILLQNPNEPRSTGGFVGSLLLVDFAKDQILWSFEDIYSLDRKIPPQKQIPAPAFFQDLSSVISLRDANLFPDFPTSAKLYQKFFEDAGEKKPDTIVAINFHLLRELLRITGPVTLDKWGLTVDENNFDLALEFLIESKVEGRFGVKKPILFFGKELLRAEHFAHADWKKVFTFSLPEFLAEKNILAYSDNGELQNLFEKWHIDGAMRKDPEADNFLYFDFVSVGANKSDKFVWTKIRHNSRISQKGNVHNTLEIVRHHALTRNEIFDLLGTNNWTPNLRDLITKDLLWILGEGENRVFVRVFLPADAQNISASSPSGEVGETVSNDKKFKVLEIPLFVQKGESVQSKIEYDTFLDRGNREARPYFLQVVGTPGRTKTEILETISTEDGGNFRVETMNIGLPVPLVDQRYRSVIAFPNP